MPLSTVAAGAQILASDHNGVVNVVNTLNSAATDPNITSDGSGDITIPNNSSYQMKDSGGVARLLVGSDTSNNVYIDMLSTTATIYFRRSDGTHIASLDSNGNLILKGTLTQGGSP